MTVYLLRHGIAENTASSGRDEDRELTSEGREKLNALLQRAAKAGVKPDTILSSPYKRAVQTAKLAVKALNGPEPVETEVLVPHGSPRGVWNEIRAYQDAHELLLAGHEPLFSQTTSYLLDAPTLKVDFKKGALVAIDFDNLRGEPRGMLRWMLIPRLCG
jgi:phosphohistidine phosphatase